MSRSRLYLALTALLLVASPATQALLAGDPQGNPPDSPAQRVDRAGCDSPWNGVGSLSIGKAVYSGVVVDARWVLTAAHVAAGRRNQPQEIRFTLPCAAEPLVREADAVVVHPDFHGYDPRRINHGDLALVRLAQPLPEHIVRYSLYPRIPRPGTVATLVGYGGSGAPGKLAVTADPLLRRVGENALDLLVRGPDQAPRAFMYDFDGPDPAGNVLGGPSVGNARETTVAGGDSGGGVFIRNEDAWQLVGISTFQILLPVKPPRIAAPLLHYGSGGGGMLLPAYIDWLHGVITGGAPP